MTPFTDEQLVIVRFCAIECALQVSGERSVYAMLGGWTYAVAHASNPPTTEDVLALGAIVEPRKNLAGFRRVGCLQRPPKNAVRPAAHTAGSGVRSVTVTPRDGRSSGLDGP